MARYALFYLGFVMDGMNDHLKIELEDRMTWLAKKFVGSMQNLHHRLYVVVFSLSSNISLWQQRVS